MINDKNVALLNQCLILVSLFTHINTKISNLEKMNMNDGYLNGKKLNYEKLKNDFVEHALLASNQNLDESNFEQIIERGKTLIRELRNYEMVKSQTAILNDWLDNDNLLEKALPLDGRIQEFVEQIDSSKLTEQKRYFFTPFLLEFTDVKVHIYLYYKLCFLFSSSNQDLHFNVKSIFFAQENYFETSVIS